MISNRSQRMRKKNPQHSFATKIIALKSLIEERCGEGKKWREKEDSSILFILKKRRQHEKKMESPLPLSSLSCFI